MNLTEKWLMEAAPWQVFKEARTLYASGAVQEASFDGVLLSGLILSQGKPRKAGLRIHGPIDVDNLCTCPTVRRTGGLCAHSVAVGIAAVKGLPAPSGRSESRERRPADRPAMEKELPPARALRLHLDARFAELWGKGRIPARILEDGAAPGVALSAWCGRAGVKTFPAQLVLNPVQAAELLDGVRGEDSVRMGKEALTVAETPAARLRARLENEGDDFRLRTEGPVEGAGQELLRFEGGAWVWFPERRLLQAMRPPPAAGASAYRALLDSGEASLSVIDLLLHLDAWQECLELETLPGQSIVLKPARPRFAAHFEGSLNALSGRVTVRYEGAEFLLGSDPRPSPFPMRRGPSEFLTRNPRAEAEARRRLTEDFEFSGPDGDGQFHLRGEERISRFFVRGWESLGADWEVELGPRFQHVTRQIEIVRPRLREVGSGEDWLSFAIDYRAGGVELSRQEVEKLLAKGQRKVRLANGTTALLDLEACEDANEALFDARPEQRGGEFRIDPAQRAYLESMVAGLTAEGEPEVELGGLGDLETRLRPYQRDGVRWIATRLEGAGGALLADEMGLGKTLQSLAVAELILERDGGQVLVVCPTTLLPNWQREIAQFFPHRRTRIVHGTKRWEDREAIGAADYLITSYALVVRDLEQWRERSFGLLLLDEASAIKNPDTQSAKAARRLRGDRRMALTGTPIENSVEELWSIFQFLLPDYLGERREFRERYELPVRSGAAPGPVMERLRKRVRPFMLRRVKEVVAADLPPKLEQVRYCEMGAAQAKLYESVLREARKEIDRALGKGSEGKARMTMLTALLRLRQVCCDPRLLEIDSAREVGSAKRELFTELLEEAIGGGHRVLVFSQFTRMLKLLGEELDAAKIGYCYLDGATRDRSEPVRRFQAGDGPPLFLMSLKAGGYGLTLTAADTVVHYDPWWNPAVEAQATDRAHRIGQTRSVTSYKLIAAGTVEERVLALQNRKRAVIDAAFEEGEPLMGGLSGEEIREVIG